MKKQLLFLFLFFSFNTIYSQLTGTLTVTQPLCSGGMGTVTINATGGVAPYEYELNHIGIYQSSNIIGPIVSGSHTATIKDAIGNTFDLNFTINLVPSLMASAINTMGVSCAGGSNAMITVTVSGGTSPYFYTLTGPVNPAPQSGSSFAGLPAGTYNVQVTDFNNCTVTTPVTIAQPSPLSVNAFASGNVITINAFGGTAPYQYSINGVAFSSNNNFIVSQPGPYMVLVRDAAGCLVNSQVLVEPPLHLTAYSTYVDYNGDGFTNVGDVVNYQFNVMNNGFFPTNNVSLAASGLNIMGGPIASLPNGASDSATFTATHVITQANINSGYVAFSFQTNGTYDNNPISNSTSDFESLSITDAIKLNAFLDANSNGIQDGAEQSTNLGDFHYVINNGTTHNINASNGTHYIYETNPANSYNLSFTLNVPNPSLYNVTTSSYNNITVPMGSGVTTYNFPVTVLPHQDLQVNTFTNGAPPRPGFTYSNRVTYKNNGNQTITSGTLTFTNSNVVSITTISQAGTTPTASGFTYDFTNLLAGESRSFDVTMQVPTIPTVALGQVLTNTVSSTIMGTDVNATNNTSSLAQIIIGSYDPNDKSEVHGGKILHSTFTSADYLTYTIQFENTGTANAVNVRVNDVLDAKLDETSIKMVNASHAYVLDRVGNTLNWKFDGIELPPSVANTTIGKGFINFQVKPKAGYVIGDIIPNTASIFFDFNPAIVTNTFTTEFVATLSVAGFENTTFTAYPNPTNDFITIALKNNAEVINSITVTDLLGKTVQSTTVNNPTATIDLSHLSKGMYLVKVKSNGVDKVLKVIKQ